MSSNISERKTREVKGNTEKVNHCMVVHAYYPLGETRVEREAHALLEHGFEVDVICLKHAGDPSEEVVDGIGVYRLPVSRHKASGRFVQLLEYLLFLFMASFKLARLYFDKKYACIQVHNLPDFLVFAAFLPKLFGAKVILDIHDMMPDFFAATIDRDMSSFLVRLIIWEERISCWFADRVICVTENARQALLNRGVPEEKLAVVMNVADSKIFFRLQEKSSPEAKQDNFRLVYHGTMTKRYGVDLIIHAVAKVRSTLPGIHLTLIGGGDLKNSLIRLTDELDLGNQIEFYQKLVISTDLPAVLRECDVGVVPNRNDCFTDGLLPTKLLEYTALGIPVIASRTSTISTYFDASMVRFFEPGDVDDLSQKINELYEYPELRQELIVNSNMFNAKYRWDKIAVDYVELVDQLIYE